MAKINLKESSQKKSVQYNPVVLSDGTSVQFTKSVDGEKKDLRGRAVKDDKELGTASFNPGTNRIFLSVHPVSEMGESLAKEIAETLMSGILMMFND